MNATETTTATGYTYADYLRDIPDGTPGGYVAHILDVPAESRTHGVDCLCDGPRYCPAGRS